MHHRGSRFAAPATLAALAILTAAEGGSGISPAPDAACLIPWGEAESELGFRAAPETEPLSVQTWCVTPPNTFLLLDPIARTVKEFEQDGEWVRSWGIDVVGSSLACGADGTPFVLDGPELRRVAPGGPPEPWARLPMPLPPGYGQGIRAGHDGGLIVADRGRTRQRVGFGARDRAVTAALGDGVRIGREGDRATARRGRDSVDLGENAGTVLPVATLADGTDVIEVERRQADGTWRLEVWLLDDAGVHRMVDTGPCDDVSVLYRRIDVGRDGTVYRARTTAEGFEILRFGPTTGVKR